MADHQPLGSDSPAATSGDWPAQITAFVVRIVDQVRSKTTAKVVVAVRASVYGLLAGLVGIAILVMLFIGVFRAADRLRNLVVEDSVWLTYVALGLVLTVAGALVFSRRKPRS